ncbi:alpha/beta fold hydrolase [Pantoea sp. 18069]|uniref:alpha/beta fold hydrolase n=1 Tax=Pantoea sp. 18069 TaxID=2681415 RepID=UPI001F463845|nr:alpha/beta fold hydrolase [Pantoea sp. 18069]
MDDRALQACTEARLQEARRMTAPADTGLHEAWIPTALGHVHAQRWPADAGADTRLPIVLLHDSLGCTALWRSFPADLARVTGQAVISYDRLGFGRSDVHPGLLTADFVASEAQGSFAAVLDAFSIDRFMVFGHSVGGGMAVSIAAAYSARCEAVITESAQSFVETLTLDGIRAARDAFAAPGQMQRLEKYHPGKAQWVLDAWVDTWLSPAFRDWSLDAALAQVRCPMLVFQGADDEFGSARQPERIAALSGGPVSLAYLAGCGHVPHRESAAQVLERVQGFVAQHGR